MKKQLFKLSAIALLLGLSQGASASVVYVGGDLGTWSSSNSSWTGDMSSVAFGADVSFEDTWSFNMGENGSVDSFAFTLGEPITGFAAKLNTASASYDFTWDTASQSLLISPMLLTAASSYTVVVSGLAGANGGTYAGSVNVSAVPEAEEWAMMLLGLGVIGTQLRRLNSVQPSTLTTAA